MNDQKRNLTLKNIGVSPVNIHEVSQDICTSNAKDKLKEVLNVYKENISIVYNVLHIETGKPSPIYGRDTKNKAEDFDRLHVAIKEKLVTTSNTKKL